MAFSPEANKPKELIEIEEHFERVGLPSEAAQALTDPGSDFNYSSLPMLVELVRFEAGHKEECALAKPLHASCLLQVDYEKLK